MTRPLGVGTGSESNDSQKIGNEGGGCDGVQGDEYMIDLSQGTSVGEAGRRLNANTTRFPRQRPISSHDEPLGLSMCWTNIFVPHQNQCHQNQL